MAIIPIPSGAGLAGVMASQQAQQGNFQNQEQIARKRRLAEIMAQSAQQTQPQTGLEAAGKLAQVISGTLLNKRADKAEGQNAELSRNALIQALAAQDPEAQAMMLARAGDPSLQQLGVNRSFSLQDQQREAAREDELMQRRNTREDTRFQQEADLRRELAQMGKSARSGVTGQPISARTPDGKNVFLQQMADGSIRPIEGFEPLNASLLSLTNPELVGQKEREKVLGKTQGEIASEDLPQSARAARQAGNVVDARKQRIDRVSDAIDKAIDQSNRFNTGLLGQNVPAVNLAANLRTIQANIGFEELQRLRDMSPTGGALGQVSEREIDFLQAVLGDLQRSQTEDQLDENLKRAKQEIIASWNRIAQAYEQDFGVPLGTPPQVRSQTAVGASAPADDIINAADRIIGAQ